MTSVAIPRHDGPVTKEQAIAFRDAQIVYPNLASDDKVKDRVHIYVQQEVKAYEHKTETLQRRWRVLTHLLRGNSVARTTSSDVHVPELYKMLETLVPRIEEAVLEYDPWFRLRGRDAEDRELTDLRAAWLDWQLDQMRWRDHVQPAIRSMLTYQVACAKVFWDTRWVDVPERVPIEGDDGSIVRIEVKKPKPKITFDGPDIRLVDPFDLVIDTRATGAQDALYVGHYSYLTLGEIQHYAELGIFDKTAVGTLKDREPRNRTATEREWNKLARSVTEWAVEGYDRSKHGVKLFKVLDLWGKFDLYGDGREIESVITLVDGEVVVQARENFYDKKIRPFAIARAAKEGWDFFNTGPLDLAVRVNQEIDRHRGNALRAHDLEISPFVIVDDASDFPDSMLDVRPGKVFESPGDVTFGSIPSTLKDYPMVHAMLRQDMEEITGAFRLMQGQEGGNTATEVERRLKEGNRRIKSYVRSFADMSEQLLRIMDSLNQQFIIKDHQFRVLGKRSKKLRDYAVIGPDTFLRDVDFEFLGIAELHTLGSRATGLMNYMQTMMPLIVQNPGEINALGMAKELYELTVGKLHSDENIKVPEDMEDLMDQVEENRLLVQGTLVEVSEGDDDVEHVRKMLPIMKSRQFFEMTEHAQYAFIKHREDHVKSFERKKARRAALEQRSQNQMLPPEAGGRAGPATSPQAGGFSAAMTPGGETPGPARDQAASKVNRAGAGVDQPRNMQ